MDCGASWTPYVVYMIDKVGVILSLVIIFLLGLFLGSEEKRMTIKPSFISYVFLFYSVFFVLSLPVGNFVFTSSSNALIFVSAFCYVIFRRVGFFIK